MYAIIMINPFYNRPSRSSQPGVQALRGYMKIEWKIFSVSAHIHYFAGENSKLSPHSQKNLRNKKCLEILFSLGRFYKRLLSNFVSSLDYIWYYLIKWSCDMFAWQVDKYSSFLVNTMVCNLIPKFCDISLYQWYITLCFLNEKTQTPMVLARCLEIPWTTEQTEHTFGSIDSTQELQNFIL